MWKSFLCQNAAVSIRIRVLYITSDKEMKEVLTCLNVSRTIVSPRAFRSCSNIRKATGSCALLVTEFKIVPRTAPSSRDEFAPCARYGSIG